MALDYAVIGERIRNARIAKKLTQEDLAEALKVSIAYLSRIEKGSTQINLRRLNQLCEVLEVTEGEIINGTAIKSEQYLEEDFFRLLKSCSSKKQKLIYKVAQVIAKDKK